MGPTQQSFFDFAGCKGTIIFDFTKKKIKLYFIELHEPDFWEDIDIQTPLSKYLLSCAVSLKNREKTLHFLPNCTTFAISH